jgi:hypothetical protein
MPGDVYKKFQKLEKDFNTASKGRAMSEPMKKARKGLDAFKKSAENMDKYNDLMSGEIAKANAKLGSDLKAAVQHIKTADEAEKKFNRDLKLLGQLQPQIMKIITPDMKKTAPVEYRALKVLGTDISAFISYATYLLKDRSEQIMSIGKEMSSAERTKNVTDKALLQLSKAVSRALSAIQKIKATPTAKIWTDQFTFAGRDVKMAFVSLVKAQAGGSFHEWDPVVTKKYLESIKDWDTQKKLSTLKGGESEKDILDRLKKFSFLIKNIAGHYNIK